MGVGYNTIRFDDEVTRHLFWRNLIDPYAREWQNGCGRWDLLDVVRCTWALRPDGITWPTHPAGETRISADTVVRVDTARGPEGFAYISDTAGGGTEVSGGSYARKSTVGADWAASSGGSIEERWSPPLGGAMMLQGC